MEELSSPATLVRMAVATINTPRFVHSEGLWHFLADLGRGGDANEIIIDVSDLKRITPAGIVALVAQVCRWRSEGRRVSFCGFERCSISDYLKRMDVLKCCGLPSDEQFARHSSKGRFVPVQKIEVDVDRLGSEMALCIAPGGDDFEHPLASLYDLIWYVLTETANNVRQHSGGTGFAAAQVGVGEGFVRMAIADNGKGVKQSFVDAGLPWSKDLDDIGAIRKALQPRISSKGSPTNEGVGLTLTAELARLVGAWLLICSGSGIVWRQPDGTFTSHLLPGGSRFHGTLVGLTFPQRGVTNFAELMDRAKQEVGLLQRRAHKGRFEP